VAAEIVDLGVEDLDCLRTATNNAVPLVEIRAVLDHFREHYQANGWGPAALHFRLSRAYPGVPPDRGWPPPDPQVERRTQRQQATQEQARAAEQRQRERNAADDAYEALEREYGSTLDGMTPEAQLALASEVGPTLVNLLRNRGSPSGKSIRQPLLSHLKNQRAA
jgi:DNA-binding transcriptional MerR regulator